MPVVKRDKLDPAACMRANEALWSRHPELKRRQLTLSPEKKEKDYRDEWNRLYDEFASKTPKPPTPRVTPVTDVPLPAPDKTGPITSCPAVASMTHEQKMAEAIERSEIWPALKDQVDLKELAKWMVIGIGVMLAAAATGVGAIVDGVVVGLVVLGGLAAGYQIGGGLMDLYDFFQMTRCDVARTQEDIDAAAKKFADGVAKTGVGGLFLLLGMLGARGKTWSGKPIKPAPPVAEPIPEPRPAAPRPGPRSAAPPPEPLPPPAEKPPLAAEPPAGKEPPKPPAGKGPKEKMIAELSENGIKHTPEDIVSIGRKPDGKVVFIENGNSRAGLQHILERHAADFEALGVPKSEVPSVVMEATTRGKPVGTVGSGRNSRTVYEIVYNNKPLKVAVGESSNGFIVTAHPVN